MSGDILMNPNLNQPNNARADPFAGSIARSKNEISSNLVPMPQVMQRLVDRRNAEKDVERARKEAEMDTPENRQKAAEAEAAERKRKKFNFHYERGFPRFIAEGWKQISGEYVDEEIRVYTIGDDGRKFWGVKPAGMAMDDFWEHNDPEVSRYHDRTAETWVNTLIRPPATFVREVWAGKGLNPDVAPTEPPIPKTTPPTGAIAKPEKTQESPTVKPTNRVTKSTTKPSKVNQRTRKSLASKIDAGHSGLADQTREVTAGAPVDTTPKRARGRPATKAKPDVQDTTISIPKRPRGRPPAKSKPAVDENHVKRPRGRPPTKAKPIETSLKQGKKTPAVKRNARIARSSQKRMRLSAPSTHNMRTRREGPAELLQL
ncbi:hypothetical protein BDR22DRAFT_891989 [Usnea florida]